MFTWLWYCKSTPVSVDSLVHFQTTIHILFLFLERKPCFFKLHGEIIRWMTVVLCTLLWLTLLDTWLASCGFKEDHRDVTPPGLLNLQWFWAKSFVQWRITPPKIKDGWAWFLDTWVWIVLSLIDDSFNRCT